MSDKTTQGTISDQGEVLQAFSRTLVREAHVLTKRPDLLWQQMYNRLQWENEKVLSVIAPQFEQRIKPGSSPWAKIRNPYRESRSTVRILQSGDEDIVSCAFSADGTRVASAHDSEIKIWDTNNWKKIFSLKGHSRWVNACTFSQDGRMVITASGDRTIKLWDAKNGNELKTFSGHDGSVYSCAMSPNGVFIVSASEDNTLKIWDVVSGENTHTLKGEVKALNPSMNDCAVSPDSRWVASANEDGTIKIWDARSGKLLMDIIGPTISAYACGLSPNGKLIVSGGYATKIWNVNSGNELHNLKGHKDSVQSCTFSPDGRRILTASLDCTLKIWDAESGIELRTLDGHSDAVNACAFSPDGRWIISASRDKTLRIWDAVSNEEDQDFSGHRYWINSCAISPNGEWAITTSADQAIKVWDTASAAELHSFANHRCDLYGCAISPDGTWFVAGGQDKLIAWDVQNKFANHTIISHLSTGILEGAFDCAVSPDGTWIVSADSNKNLKIWDSKSRKWVRTLTGHGEKVLGCTVSPDGERVISASADKTLKIWEASTGQLLETLSGHAGVVTACAANPNNTWIVSASRDNTIKIWDARNGNILRTLSGHSDDVTDIAVSQDGAHIISCSKDNTIRMWSVDDGKVMVTIPMPAAINCLAMHPLPTFIACGDQGGNFYLFDLIGLPIHPLFTTAHKQGQDLVLRCPACNKESPINSGQLGNETICSCEKCKARLIIKPSAIRESCSSADRSVEEMIISSQISLDNDGKLFLGYSNGNIGLLENDKEQPDVVSSGDSKPICKFAVSPDGSKGISGSGNGDIFIWDLYNRSLRNLIPHSGRITAIAIGKDDWVAIGYGEEGTLEFWKFYEPKETVRASLKSEITAIGMLPEGHILVGTKDKHAFFLDMATKKMVKKYSDLADHIAVVGASQTRKHVIAGMADDHVFHGSIENSFSTLRIKHPPILAIAVEDQPTLLTGGADGIMRIINFDSKNLILSREFKESIVCGTLSPDGRFYAVLGVNGNIFRGEINHALGKEQSTLESSKLLSVSLESQKKTKSDLDEEQAQKENLRDNEHRAAENIQQQAHLVTAEDSNNGPVIYCPICQFCQPINREMLGKESVCTNPECNASLRINVFVTRSADSKKKKKRKK